MIEIRHMQAAVAVADELNFSRAANQAWSFFPYPMKRVCSTYLLARNFSSGTV